MQTSDESVAPVPVDRPYLLEELDESRVLVRFGKRVDHPRPGHVEPLREALRTHDRMAHDLTATRTMISGWIRVLRDLSLEARDTGKIVGIVRMHGDLRGSADVIKSRHALNFYDSVDEVWTS